MLSRQLFNTKTEEIFEQLFF